MSFLHQTDPTNRYFPNKALTDPSAFRSTPSPRANLLASLANLIATCPPTLPWAGREPYSGLFSGPTSVAFLFLWLSKTHPELRINHKSPADYCGAYLDLGQDQYGPDETPRSGCSLHHEYMCYHAVQACYTQDMRYVRRFAANLRNLMLRPASVEVLYGKAGLLGLMRTVKYWLPESSATLDPEIDRVIEHCLAHDPWTFGSRPDHQKRYLGAAHGDVSIVSNIVMANPAYAPRVQGRLEHLLSLQRADGNWRSREDGGSELVQWCHGAPGMVWCLVPMRQHFPALGAEIDAAIVRARRVVWEKGLLTKESCLCHGIMGNALALEGPQRGHFLFYTTPEMVAAGLEDGSLESSDDSGLWWGEASRAWGWMMADYDGGGRGDSLVDIGYPGVTNP